VIRRTSSQLDGARRWARRLTILERVLHVLLLGVIVTVALLTHDYMLMMYIAFGWFAVSLALRVAAGLLRRWP
jgi:hypothetical protein